MREWGADAGPKTRVVVVSSFGGVNVAREDVGVFLSNRWPPRPHPSIVCQPPPSPRFFSLILSPAPSLPRVPEQPFLLLSVGLLKVISRQTEYRTGGRWRAQCICVAIHRSRSRTRKYHQGRDHQRGRVVEGGGRRALSL